MKKEKCIELESEFLDTRLFKCSVCGNFDMKYNESMDYKEKRAFVKRWKKEIQSMKGDFIRLDSFKKDVEQLDKQEYLLNEFLEYLEKHSFDTTNSD